ncbi:MAG: associated protein Cas2 [Actinomycetota bacterium]|jgi:CRISPR-associated endonuclease Cas2|nr:associated protein Cas2 [Actinomycetota bacterium]
MRRHLVVVYDVVDDARRAVLRNGLRPIADRIQQSGWVVPSVVGFDLRRLSGALAPILDSCDRLRIYEPCPRCWSEARWFPNEPGPYDGPVVVV